MFCYVRDDPLAAVDGPTDRLAEVGDGPDGSRATAFVDGDDWRVGELHRLTVGLTVQTERVADGEPRN